MRESSALDVIELLLHKGADVRYHDPYVPIIRHKHGDADARRSAQMGLDLAGWQHADLCDYQDGANICGR